MDDFRNKVIVKGPRVKFENIIHRVDRVLGFFSSRPNWDSPTPSPADKCAPPPLVPGGDPLACGKGVERSQFQRGDRHCGTLGIIYMCFVIFSQHFCFVT
jgi:hypothetical protein